MGSADNGHIECSLSIYHGRYIYYAPEPFIKNKTKKQPPQTGFLDSYKKIILKKLLDLFTPLYYNSCCSVVYAYGLLRGAQCSRYYIMCDRYNMGRPSVFFRFKANWNSVLWAFFFFLSLFHMPGKRILYILCDVYLREKLYGRLLSPQAFWLSYSLIGDRNNNNILYTAVYLSCTCAASGRSLLCECPVIFIFFPLYFIIIIIIIVSIVPILLQSILILELITYFLIYYCLRWCKLHML